MFTPWRQSPELGYELDIHQSSVKLCLLRMMT